MLEASCRQSVERWSRRTRRPDPHSNRTSHLSLVYLSVWGGGISIHSLLLAPFLSPPKRVPVRPGRRCCVAGCDPYGGTYRHAVFRADARDVWAGGSGERRLRGFGFRLLAALLAPSESITLAPCYWRCVARLNPDFTPRLHAIFRIHDLGHLSLANRGALLPPLHCILFNPSRRRRVGMGIGHATRRSRSSVGRCCGGGGRRLSTAEGITLHPSGWHLIAAGLNPDFTACIHAIFRIHHFGHLSLVNWTTLLPPLVCILLCPCGRCCIVGGVCDRADWFRTWSRSESSRRRLSRNL